MEAKATESDRPNLLEAVAPASGESLGAVTIADRKAVQEAVAEARAVQPLWAQLRLSDRARYMHRAAQAVIDESGELVELLCREQGRPRAEAEVMEVLPAVETLQWLAEAGPTSWAERRRASRACCTRSRVRDGRTSRSEWSQSWAPRPSRSPPRWAMSRSR